LLNNRQYAFITWSAITKTQIRHQFYTYLCWLVDLVLDYRIYFNNITFICNPITRMVSVDYEIIVEQKIQGTDQWIKM
jgi:hypothetical protein